MYIADNVDGSWLEEGQQGDAHPYRDRPLVRHSWSSLRQLAQPVTVNTDIGLV